MSRFDRRTFLLLGMGTLLSGCVGTYWTGRTEIPVVPDSPKASPPPPPAIPAADPELPLGTPIYEDTSSHWKPDLTPVERSCWSIRAARPGRMKTMGRIWRITVHHEGSPSGNFSTRPREVARDLRQIQNVHMDQHRTGDIGYHFIIDRAGRVWQGRSPLFCGAHAGGKANHGNLGIMLLGNFDLQEPTARQKIALQAFLKFRMTLHGVPAKKVLTHRELKATRCPGQRLQDFMDQIRLSL